MDACIMDGTSMKVGAVSGVQDIYHPILLARKVMEKTQFNFLGAKGAMQLAKEEGFKFLKKGDLESEYARASFERWMERQQVDPDGKPDVSFLMEK